MAFLSAAGTRGTTGHSIQSKSCEGGQSKIVLFLYKDNRRSQRLGATLFLSYSSFFMISCRGEQTKKKAVSAEGEGPATAETTDPLLVLSRLLRVREAWNHKYEGSRRVGRALASLLLAFSLPRGALATRLKGEGRRRLTYGFKAWREAKGLDFTYDQISGQPLLTFFVVLLTLLKANFEVGLAFLRWEQLTLWWRRCREDLGVSIVVEAVPSLISMFVPIPSFAVAAMDAPLLVESMLPSPNRSSSEDSFGLRVLCEPWPIIPDLGLESSIVNRIRVLEAANSPFLLGKAKGEYWAEIKESLRNSSYQREYYRGLDFENRDLLIRERKHSCYEVFREILLRNPSLEEAAAYPPQENFISFLNEKRDALDVSHPGHSPAEVDRLEILFLKEVEKDLVKNGSGSIHIIGNLN
ncbi:uncharacterized mitochondrial protein AtMg01280-like [Brassica rapa]|uniref:uncharacterized mitochondrial protein AtMg01280-like n=1 Tax=Brassica campestris TaxID=3711 RepID=UPI00142D8CC9|nr:uncharacterized mitochondrial protein AtMg01280-like [Brassica rapa]